MAMGIVGVLSLPLAGPPLWRLVNPTAAVSPKSVKSVRWAGKQFLSNGRVLPMEMTIEFPSKMRVPGYDGYVNSDYRTGLELIVLAKPRTFPWHPTPYRYLRLREPAIAGKTLSSSYYTLSGRLQALSRSAGHNRPKLTQEQLPNGRVRHTVQYQVPRDGSSAPYSVTMEVDPKTGLLLAWEESYALMRDGKRLRSRVKVSRVEYNPHLPADYFTTTPPPGAEVEDYATPESLKRIYTEALAQVEKLSADPARQRALVEEISKRHVFMENEFGLLSEADQQALLPKMKEYGIIPAKPGPLTPRYR